MHHTTMAMFISFGIKTKARTRCNTDTWWTVVYFLMLCVNLVPNVLLNSGALITGPTRVSSAPSTNTMNQNMFISLIKYTYISYDCYICLSY